MAFELLMRRYRATSDPLLTERRIELVALILTAIFILQLLYSVARLIMPAQPESVLPAPDTLVVSELKRFGALLDEQRADLRARPVFWASRRTIADSVGPVVAVAPVSKPKAKKSELDKIKLLGIFGVGDSSGIIALVEGKKKRILRGDKMVGWTLESINGGHAVFTNGGQSQDVMLARSNNPVPLPAATLPAAPDPIKKSKGLSFGADPRITKK